MFPEHLMLLPSLLFLSSYLTASGGGGAFILPSHRLIPFFFSNMPSKLISPFVSIYISGKYVPLDG